MTVDVDQDAANMLWFYGCHPSLGSWPISGIARGWEMMEGSPKGCGVSETTELPKLLRKDDIWQAGSLDLLVSLSDLKV